MAIYQEAFRVLEPGGILVAQLNGAPPAAEHTDTWIGAWIPAGELASGIRDSSWRLLSLEGAEIRCSLLVHEPETHVCPPSEAETSKIRARIDQITGPYGNEPKADAGGPRSFLSLFLSELPDFCCDINSLQVRLASRVAAITFIGPTQPGDWRQINIRVSSDAPPGPTPVRVFWHGHAVNDSAQVEIAARPPLQPRIVSVTDGRDILSNGRIVTEWFQMTLAECADIDRLRVPCQGWAAGFNKPKLFALILWFPATL